MPGAFLIRAASNMCGLKIRDVRYLLTDQGSEMSPATFCFTNSLLLLLLISHKIKSRAITMKNHSLNTTIQAGQQQLHQKMTIGERMII